MEDDEEMPIEYEFPDGGMDGVDELNDDGDDDGDPRRRRAKRSLPFALAFAQAVRHECVASGSASSTSRPKAR